MTSCSLDQVAFSDAYPHRSLMTDRDVAPVASCGSLDLTRDKHGLAQALALKALVDQVVQHLQAAEDLLDAVPGAAPKSSEWKQRIKPATA